MSEVIVSRAGNAIALANDPFYSSAVCAALRYTHRTYFSGAELRARKIQGVRRPEFEDSVRDLFMINNDEIVAPAGLYSRVHTTLLAQGFTPVFKDLRKNVRPPADFTQLANVKGFEMRYRIDECLAAVDASLGGVLHLPTGHGKTMLMMAICKVYPRSRCAIVLPGRDLLSSVRDRIVNCLNEMPGVIGDGSYVTGSRITLCSSDSLHKLDMDKQQLILYDEVHTAATPVRSQRLLSQYTDANMYGLSANVGDRADKADALIEAIFGPVLVSVPYEEAADAGVVSQITVLPVRVPEIYGFESRMPKQMEFRKRFCYTANVVRNATIVRVCRSLGTLLPQFADPQVLVMGETVEHLFNIASELPEYEVVYANMSDNMRERLITAEKIPLDFEPITPQRRTETLKRFERGEARKVLANHCWKQGIDPKHLDVLFRIDGGTSDINNTQIPGRLSRKQGGVLIDLVDGFSKWTEARWTKRRNAYRELGFRMLEPVSV